MRLSTILIVLAASALASQVTVTLTKRQRSGVYLKSYPEADRVRAVFLKSRTTSGPTTVQATNLGYEQYTTRVGIGCPPTYYDLIIDTGSSNTFCGTGIPYARTPTSISTGEVVGVTYGSSNFDGLEYLDRVTLAPNLVLINQSIGDAISYAGFLQVDGILGLGPLDLTLGTLTPDSNATIPTVMNNLVSQGLIAHQILGVYFAPPTSNNDTNGALTYGGADSSFYKDQLTYVPVTKTFPSSAYWGINVTLCTYGNHKIIPTPTAGVIDSGTSLILLASDFFDAYVKAIPGGKVDSNTGLLEIPESSLEHMQPLNFTIGDRAFVLDATAQLLPVDEDEGSGGARYGAINDMGAPSGQGLDFILGQKFMERYYVVFDTGSNRVGFAETANTFSSG